MKIKPIARCIREYRKQTVLAPLFITIEVILECLMPFIMSRLVDSISSDSLTDVIKYGALLISFAVMSLLSGFLAGKFAATASCGFAKNLRHDIYYKIQSFAFADIDRFSASSLVTRMTTDVTNIQMSFQMLVRIAFRAPLMIIFSFAMSLSVNAGMSLIFLAILPVLMAVMGIIMRVTIPIFRRIFKKYDALNNSVQENVSGIRVVKNFVREDYENKKFGKASFNVKEDFTMVERILALINPTMMLCIFTAMLLLSVLGARLIITSVGSRLTTGELSSLISYGVQILSSLMMVSMVIVMLTMAGESAKRISEVLEAEATLTNRENTLKEIKNGEIVFKNVSFKYSEKAKRNALENINLTIKSGETLGILGGTGSSKSTLVQLIPRLYDVTEGSVSVGGTDVRDYDITALRDSVSMVLQKNVVFSGTIKDNLRWGDKNATDEEIKRVCVLAQADEFICAMPDGYDTLIERGGTNVSGGQKQRLCIARALLKKPKVLILDDSTSAVDTRTDAKIKKALREELPNTTKIIIAQRVSSVEDADKIAVMDAGKIAEYGTHSELMALGGIYREIYDEQTKGEGE